MYVTETILFRDKEFQIYHDGSNILNESPQLID